MSSSSPAQERSDGQAPREWCGSPSKTQNKSKKRDGNRDSDDRLRDLLEWLEELTNHLEDTEAHAPAHISQDSDSGRPTKGFQNQGSTAFTLTSQKTENGEVCLRTKMTRAPCRRRTGEAPPRAEKFGDLITTDHKVLSENCESRKITDTQSWCRTWPPNGSSRIRVKTKTSQETQRSLQKFLEPDRMPKVIYIDNSLELGKACEDLSWNHCTSTPHRSETNGIAERAVCRVNEGTSAVLLQSGLNENWWADSMECNT